MVICATEMGNARYDPIRRHYKKDTRFLLDLYTLTYDEGETVSTHDVKVLTVLTIFTQFCASIRPIEGMIGHHHDDVTKFLN